MLAVHWLPNSQDVSIVTKGSFGHTAQSGQLKGLFHCTATVINTVYLTNLTLGLNWAAREQDRGKNNVPWEMKHSL